MKNKALFLYAFTCLTPYILCSDIVFTTTTSTIRPLVTDELTLTCSLKDSAPPVVIGRRNIRPHIASDTSPSDVSFVHSIVITKSGADLASVSEHVPAQVYDNTTGVNVTGKIPGSGADKGYLQVTWKYPGPAQSGSYQCDVIGVTQSGHDLSFNQALDVTETEVSLNDVLGYIHQIKLENDLQNTKLDRLDTHVMFTAILASPVKSGSAIVFNQLQTDIGGGYNVTTGVFTCRVAGLYVFHVHITGYAASTVQAYLKHNGNTVTAVEAYHGADYPSASTSATLKLQRGDTINVSSGSAQNTWGHTYGFSSFSGYLIAVA